VAAGLRETVAQQFGFGSDDRWHGDKLLNKMGKSNHDDE